MSTTEPIRDVQELKDFIGYYEERTDLKMERNYVMILTGLYTALRIGDVLDLRWGDVIDVDKGRVRDSIYVVEKKTHSKKTEFSLRTQMMWFPSRKKVCFGECICR